MNLLLPLLTIFTLLPASVHLNEQKACIQQRADEACLFSYIEIFIDATSEVSKDQMAAWHANAIADIEPHCSKFSADTEVSCLIFVRSRYSSLIQFSDGQRKATLGEKLKALDKRIPRETEPAQRKAWRLLAESAKAKSEEDYNKVGEELSKLLSKRFEPIAASNLWAEFINNGKKLGYSFKKEGL